MRKTLGKRNIRKQRKQRKQTKRKQRKLTKRKQRKGRTTRRYFGGGPGDPAPDESWGQYFTSKAGAVGRSAANLAGRAVVRGAEWATGKAKNDTCEATYLDLLRDTSSDAFLPEKKVCMTAIYKRILEEARSDDASIHDPRCAALTKAITDADECVKNLALDRKSRDVADARRARDEAQDGAHAWAAVGHFPDKVMPKW